MSFGKTQFETLFAYHWHTTRHVLAAAAQLSQAETQEDPEYGRGSIHDLLFHLLQTDRSWRMALLTGRQASGIRQEEYPDLASLQAGLTTEQEEWESYLAGLSEDDISAQTELTSWRGDRLRLPRWRVLQHLVLHGMQHHADLARLLTAKGQSPGDIDFIFYR